MWEQGVHFGSGLLQLELWDLRAAEWRLHPVILWNIANFGSRVGRAGAMSVRELEAAGMMI